MQIYVLWLYEHIANKMIAIDTFYNITIAKLFLSLAQKPTLRHKL